MMIGGAPSVELQIERLEWILGESFKLNTILDGSRRSNYGFTLARLGANG